MEADGSAAEEGTPPDEEEARPVTFRMKSGEVVCTAREFLVGAKLSQYAQELVVRDGLQLAGALTMTDDGRRAAALRDREGVPPSALSPRGAAAGAG